MAQNIDKLLKQLEELDSMLENTVFYADLSFNALDNLKDASLEYAQEQIDIRCEKISEKVNKALEDKKISAVNVIKDKYSYELAVIQTLKPIVDLVNLNINLDNVVTVLKDVIITLTKPYLGPYQNSVQFVAEISTKATPLIQNISQNATKLSTLPDDIQSKIYEINPQLNLDKLQISFEPPSIDDFIS